jgi:hypothetical protein
MASGIPSSRRQIDTATGLASSPADRATPPARARSANSATASQDPGAAGLVASGPGSDIDGTR